MFESFRNLKGKLPLVLGVTGHRDLRPEDLPELRLKVREVLEGIRKQWDEIQEGAAAPLYLLSGMAAGADQLAAEVALEMGIGVIAVLPMPLKQYEKDFPKAEEKRHLKELLGRASGVVTIPWAGGKREAQYEAEGTFISRQCSYLIALWDGIHLKKVGGTSHVVRMKLHGADSNVDGSLSDLEMATPGPVCHILTPRQSSKIRSDFKVRILRNSEEGTEVAPSTLEDDLPHSEEVKKPAEFNRDWLRMAPRFRSKAKAFSRGLVPSDKISPEEEFVAENYGVASALAAHYQRVSIRFVKLYFVFLLFAGMVLEGGYYYFLREDKVMDADPFEIAYFFLMVLLLSLYWYSRKKEFSNRYHEYRALAEGLRVQMFWRLAGLPDSVSNHYLAHQVGEMGWICKALYAIQLPLSPPKSSDINALHEHWVKDQLAFFKSSVKKNADMSKKFNQAGGAALGLSFAWVFIRIWHSQLAEMVPGPWKMALAIFFVGMAGTSVMAFVLFGYEHFRGFSEHAKRHHAMIPLFEMGMRVLSGPIKEEAARKVVLQLGKEALAENGYWLILHHQQELDFG